MQMFKRIRVSYWAVLVSLLLISCSTLDSPPSSSASVTVSLLSFNDFHGNLLPFGGSAMVTDPATGKASKVPAGGVAYLSTLVRNLKATNPDNTLVVAAGDLVGASPQSSGLFHDEPTIDAMNQIGLELSAVGNHEFDKGRDELLRQQGGGCFPASPDGTRGLVGVDTCMNDGRFDGAKFRYLTANVIDEKTGNTLFPQYVVRRIGGVKIGFVGVTLKDTPAVVTPKGVEGLRFTDEAVAVNRLVPELKQQGVAFVVVLMHQGASTKATTINDKSCPGFAGEALQIADKLDAVVEVVVTGHSHAEYACRRPDGKLLTQAGNYGRLLTKIDLTVDPQTGRVLRKEASAHVVSNDLLPKDAATDALVQRYAKLTKERAEVVVAQLAAPLDRVQSAAGESTLGDVITDAYLAGTSDAAYGPQAAQIALVNAGGIRSDLSRGQAVTYGQLYSVHPFGNNLVTLSLSGAQLQRLLEQQWESPQPAGGRMLSVSSGFTYAWDASQTEGAVPGTGRRVVPGSMKLNGVPIEAEKTYRVTVNSFLSSGGDNFTELTKGTRKQEGSLDLEVLTAYFTAKKTIDLPMLGRIKRVN